METQIERITTDTIDQMMNSTRANLLKEAAQHLGYKQGNSKSLISLLSSLDIRPFRTSAVDAYKGSKEKVGIFSGTKLWYLWFIGQFFVAAGLVLGAKFGVHNGIDWIAVPCLFLVIACIPSFIMSLVFRGETCGEGTRKVTEWKRYDIKYYEGTVPDHALNLAVQLKKSNSNISLYVDRLEDHYQQYSKPRPDPFLFVKLGDEGYYIEQWNEKDLPKIDE